MRTVCALCQQHHNQVNRTFQCYMKQKNLLLPTYPTAGITAICKAYTGKKLLIQCDSQPAIVLCQAYIEYPITKTKFQHIKNSDLISQGTWFTNINIDIQWVKGHDKNTLNNQCDYLASLQHTNLEYSDLIIQTNMETPPDVAENRYFNVRHLIYALNKNKLDPRFYLIKEEFMKEIKNQALPMPLDLF